MYYNITECVPINESISGGYRPGRGWPAYKRMSVEQMEEIMEETPLTPRYDTLPGKSVDNAQKKEHGDTKRRSCAHEGALRRDKLYFQFVCHAHNR